MKFFLIIIIASGSYHDGYERRYAMPSLEACQQAAKAATIQQDTVPANFKGDLEDRFTVVVACGGEKQ